MTTTSSLPHKNIGVAVIWNSQGLILIDRRLPKGAMGGLWEFPGGKIEANETVEECIQREVKEELGIEVQVGKNLITIHHTYPKFMVTLNVHHCLYISGDPQTIECDEIRWVNLSQLNQFTFPEANVQIIDALRESKFSFEDLF